MTDFHTIGIDISKARLDVFRLPGNEQTKFENNEDGHKKLLKWLGGPETVERIVYEPTSRFHQRLERVLSVGGFSLAKVNPWQGRRFSQACGVRVKTDTIDARMLAVMGRSLPLGEPYIPDENQRKLKELQVARQALIKDQTAAKNRSKGLTLPVLKKQSKRRLAQIQKDMEAIEAAMQAIVKADPVMARNLVILCSIPAIGSVTAMAILAELPEIGTLTPAAVASLTGLAPFTRESGQFKGKRFIQGGRKPLRDALYMSALVATRFNQDMKIFYQRLIQNGKPHKVALTAVMRKIILLANTLVKQDRVWAKIKP